MSSDAPSMTLAGPPLHVHRLGGSHDRGRPRAAEEPPAAETLPLWPQGTPGAVGKERRQQGRADDHGLPARKAEADRGRGRDLPRRRLRLPGDRPRGEAGRRVAQLARRRGVSCSSTGSARAIITRRCSRTPAGRSGRSGPGERVEARPEPGRDPRLLGRRPPRLDRRHPLRRRQARRRRPDRATELAARPDDPGLSRDRPGSPYGHAGSPTTCWATTPRRDCWSASPTRPR